MLKPCVGLAPCCLRHHALQHQQTKILTLEPQVVSQELEPVAPPRTVDYEVETDELALLQVGVHCHPCCCCLRCCCWLRCC